MPGKSRCTLMNRRTQAPLCEEFLFAGSIFTRLVGLLAHRALPPHHGLWLQPSNGIHTMGMRFSIDVVGLDRHGIVVKTAESVQPWRIVGMPRGTRSVVELPAGHLRNNPVQVGDIAFATYTNQIECKKPKSSMTLAHAEDSGLASSSS